MQSNTGVLILLTIILSVAIDNVRSCSCRLAHPQEEFCNVDAVMLIKTRSASKKWTKTTYHKNWEGKNDFDRPFETHYYTRIRKTFKLNDNSSGLTQDSKSLTIITYSQGSMCGIELSPNTKYLVSGNIINGNLHIDLCNVLNMDWRWVTLVQRKNLRFMYQANCDCQILDKNDKEANQVIQTGCYWPKHSKIGKCQERHSACIHDKNSTTGGCKWQRNPHMKECVAQANGLKPELP